MKPFSQNLEIQGSCCEVIISKLGQRDSICISCTNGSRNINMRTHNNFGSKTFF